MHDDSTRCFHILQSHWVPLIGSPNLDSVRSSNTIIPSSASSQAQRERGKDWGVGRGWEGVGVSFTPSTSRFSMSTVEQTWGRRRSKALLIRRAIGFNAGSDILQTVLLSGCPPSLRTQLTLRTQQAAPTNRRFIGLPRFLQISTPLVRFRLPFLYSLQKQSA